MFKLPIEYIEKKEEIPQNIIDDLELMECKIKEDKSVYEEILNPKTCFGKDNISLWTKYFSQDEDFLKENQLLLKKLDEKKIILDKEICSQMKDIWEKRREEQGDFLSHYNYIEFSKLQFLNKSSIFLEVLSVYNLLSPLLTLLTPIFMLIIPFIILYFTMRAKNIPFNLSLYGGVIEKLFGNFAFVKLFTSDSLSVDKRMTLYMSCIFYVFSMYQSINSCYRFYKNLDHIQETFMHTKRYLQLSIKNMDELIYQCDDLNTFNNFKQSIMHNRLVLKEYHEKLNLISESKFNMRKITELGFIMKQFYDLHKEEELEESIQFSFGCNGYMDHLHSLKDSLNKEEVNECKFSKKIMQIKKGYFVKINAENRVKNDVTIKDKNIIITGPNAAGKTTILKSTLLNIILSQQIGVGYYKSANIKCVDYIHCYLNIPDTGGRDSLFQAEARRCIEILNFIEQHPNKEHFCIFDELYSGTNPYEAVSTAYSYLKYMNKLPNVKYMLTTHYINLCKYMKKQVVNKHMKIDNNNNDFKYTYEYVNGISKIRGGLKVLENLHYPSQILMEANKVMSKI